MKIPKGIPCWGCGYFFNPKDGNLYCEKCRKIIKKETKKYAIAQGKNLR